MQDNRFYRLLWSVLMAAEMIGCAVAQEAVNEVLSRIKEGYAEKSDAN